MLSDLRLLKALYHNSQLLHLPFCDFWVHHKWLTPLPSKVFVGDCSWCSAYYFMCIFALTVSLVPRLSPHPNKGRGWEREATYYTTHDFYIIFSVCTTISKHLSLPSVHDHVYNSQWKFWCVAGTNMWECIACFMNMYPNPEFESMTPLLVLIQWWQSTFII